jgi:hypothetical protein
VSGQGEEERGDETRLRWRREECGATGAVLLFRDEGEGSGVRNQRLVSLRGGSDLPTCH